MQTSPSNIALQSKQIQLYVSSELSELVPFRVSHYLVALICGALLIGILCAVGMSMRHGATATSGALRASIQAEAGTIVILRRDSDAPLRLLPGRSALVSSGDQIDARQGRATITYFDGAVQIVDGANVILRAPSPSGPHTSEAPTPAWIQQLWNQTGQPRSHSNAASVLG